MAPIRTAFIGLSPDPTSWGKNAHAPYLLSARGRERYEIVALCNSTVDNARAAIAHYELPDTVRAYDSPADLARDENVELVVCLTRVDVHHRTIIPVLEAGKAVISEWPLASNVADAKELTALAAKKGVRNAVAMQGRFSPVSKKIREVLESGRIGKIFSIEVMTAGGVDERDAIQKRIEYYLDRSIGGNNHMIGFAHTFDTLESQVGEILDLRSQMHLQRPTLKLRGSDEISVPAKATVPDLNITTGRLASSDISQADASVLIRQRNGPPWPGVSPFVMNIHGEKGELRVEIKGGMWISVSVDKPMTIQLHDFATDTVEDIEWSWDSWQTELPFPSQNTAAMYEAYANGDGYMTFADALKTQERLDELLAEFVSKHP